MMKRIGIILILITVITTNVFASFFEIGLGQTFSKSIDKNFLNNEESYDSTLLLSVLYRASYPFFFLSNFLFISNYKEVCFGGGIRLLPKDWWVKLDYSLLTGIFWKDNRDNKFYLSWRTGFDFKFLADQIFFSVGVFYKTFDTNWNINNKKIELRFFIGCYL